MMNKQKSKKSLKNSDSEKYVSETACFSTQSGARKRIERLFKVAGLLENATALGRKITTSDLMEDLEVDRSTISRDIEFLRDLGLQIEWDSKNGTYEVLSGSKYLPAMELGSTDYLMLEFLQQNLAQYGQSELGRQMIASFQRLFGIFTGREANHPLSGAVAIRTQLATPDGENELRVFRLMERAIALGRVLTFTYQSSRTGETHPKSVEPHLIALIDGRWRLYGIDTFDRRIVSFAFGRMTDVRVTDHRVGKNLSQYFNRLLEKSFGGVVSDAEPWDVVIEFEARAAVRVRESHCRATQSLTTLPDGRVRLTLGLNSHDEIIPWILSWGPEATVIAPDRLSQEIAALSRRMADRFELALMRAA